MSKFRYAETHNIYPLLAPVDTATSAVSSQYLDLKYVQHGTLLAHFGNLTSDSTDTITVTLEASTAGSSNATEVAFGFNYRLSGAVATNSMGAITAATSDGVAVTAADDNKVLVIDLDPSVVANIGADYRYIRATLTPSAGSAISIVGVTSIIEPRYAGNAIPSSS